jgi:multidrug efflux pump subunit AcrB
LFDTPFYERFRRIVNWCVQHRWITIGLTVGTLVLGVFGMTKVQNQFFPDSNRLEVIVDLWYPEGSSFASNEAVTRRVEARLMTLGGADHLTTWVGSGLPRFALVLDQISQQSNVSQIVVLPKNLKAREMLRIQLPELMATEFPEVRARAKLLPNGPPVAYPVQFRVGGTDAAQVRAYADEAKVLMLTNPNMRGVNDNWNESVKVLRLNVDQDKARALGVSSQAIAQATRTLNSGTTVGQYRDGDKLIDIVLRQPKEERDALTDLANAYVPTTTGRNIPLGQIAKADFVWEPGVLWRENRDYAATVQGDIVDGLQGATVTDQLNPLCNYSGQLLRRHAAELAQR